MPSPAFARFWQTDLTRECFLSYLTKDDLQTLRLVSHDFSETISPVLFKEIKLEFNATSFSRQSRLAALSRVGHHVKTFTFHMPHSDDTFLPPLMDPDTLQEISFQYEPRLSASRPTSSSSNSSGSKYGSWELNDLLVRQYPLLFHTATNVTSFIRAINTMPELRHLRISCPGQIQGQRHRRDIVDYALISLRLAIEQSNPEHLRTLTLDPIHPSATFYLRPQISIGSSPASTRVWRRIKTLNVVMESFETSQPEPTTDHLKTLHTYLSSFSSLENLSFKWLGKLKGPNPLSLSTEPCVSRPSSLDYSSCISHEKRSSTASTGFSSLRPLRFRRLKTMRIENATFDASQSSAFIMAHRKTVREFQYERCHLRSGTWDDALSALTHISGNEDWKHTQYDPSLGPPTPPPKLPRTTRLPPLLTSFPPPPPPNEIMDVPIMLSPDSDKAEEVIELVTDQMWQDKEVQYFDDCDDLFDTDGRSFLSAWGSPRRRRRGVDALRRFGTRFGIPYSVKESDIAMESVRKLLKGCRVVAWH